jgi:LPXTG-motif cell wall-anchored protein
MTAPSEASTRSRAEISDVFRPQASKSVTNSRACASSGLVGRGVRTLGAFGIAAGLVVAGPASAFAASPAAAPAPANVGLFGSQDPTFDGVYRQSLAIIALEATGHTPDANAVVWLLGQQCADGAFTAYRATPATTACTPATEDENATAAAIQALVALGKPTTTAVAALRHFQLADGGFYDNTAFGPASSDANSTGLALSALAAAGVDPATVVSSSGKTGDGYLRSLQLACSATTAGGAYDFQAEPTLHANDYATVQGLLGELGKALPVPATSATSSVPACPTSITDAATSATAAVSYLAGRLAAANGAIPSAFGSGIDWTTTANAVLDLEAADQGASAITAGLAALETNAKAYTQTAGKFGAGPLATLLLVAKATGSDPTTFGGIDLASVLAGTERLASTTPVATPVVVAKPPVAAAKPPVAAAKPPVATLPATGYAGTEPLAAVGVALLGLGLGIVAMSRRRSGSRTT